MSRVQNKTLERKSTQGEGLLFNVLPWNMESPMQSMYSAFEGGLMARQEYIYISSKVSFLITEFAACVHSKITVKNLLLA